MESKRLAIIYEEHAREYAEPRTDSDLEARRREALKLRDLDVKQVVEMQRRT